MARIQSSIDRERRRRRLRAFVAPSPAEAREGRLQPPAGAVCVLYERWRLKGALGRQGGREHTLERDTLRHSSTVPIPCHSGLPTTDHQ